MYLLILLIVIIAILYFFNKKEKFTISSNYNRNLEKVLKSDNKELVYNSVIPAEYKKYLLDNLIYIFNFLSVKTDGGFRYIPYEIIEVISENDNINVIFFANSRNEFNSLIFKVKFKLYNNKLELISINLRDDKKMYGINENNKNIFGIDTFKIIYPNLNQLIDLDSISGIKNKDISNFANIDYKINPIINPNLLRVNILPITNIKDYFPKYPFWNDFSIPSSNSNTSKYLHLGNYYTPGMFSVKTAHKSIFSKLYDIPSFPFSNSISANHNNNNSCTNKN